MIRLLFTLSFLAALALGASWLANHPGEVTVFWLDWRIDTSFAAFALIALLTAFAAVLVLSSLRRLVQAPRRFMRWRTSRHYAQGLQAVTEGVAALMIADTPLAIKNTKRAQELLGSQPITLLMQAQVAKLQGDDEKMVDLLESMLNHPETQFLAARSLADHAIKRRSVSGALPYAQQAADLHPGDAQAVIGLLAIYLRLERFDEASLLLQRGLNKRALLRSQQRRLMSYVHWQQATKLLEKSDAALALHAARQAHKLNKDFVPYAALLARCYWKNGDEEAAFQLIRQMWKHQPHPDYLSLFFDIYTDNGVDVLLKKAEKLTAANKNHELSHLLLAQAYAKARKWSAARNAAKEALALRENPVTLSLLSDIENGEYGDFDAAHQWLKKASEAPTEVGWRCSNCNTHHASWHSLCSACGAVGTIEMQPPYNQQPREVSEFGFVQ